MAGTAHSAPPSARARLRQVRITGQYESYKRHCWCRRRLRRSVFVDGVGARRAGAREADLLEVRFAYPRPAYVAQYEAMFGPRLHFDAAESGVYFPGALLDAPLPGHDRMVYESLRLQVECALAQRLNRVDVVQTLRGRIMAALPRLMAVDEAAQTMEMSGRTLRRHLSARGLGYGELVQQCQRELAERLLREGRVPLKQIADETGFSSPSCFHRAFRRWHGTTPLEWRTQLP